VTDQAASESDSKENGQVTTDDTRQATLDPQSTVAQFTGPLYTHNARTQSVRSF